jgi:hypothetical protein
MFTRSPAELVELVIKLCQLAEDENYLALEPISATVDPLIGIGINSLINGDSTAAAITAIERTARAEIGAIRARSTIAAEAVELIASWEHPSVIRRRLEPLLAAASWSRSD